MDDDFGASSVLSVLLRQLRLHVGSHIPLLILGNRHPTQLTESIPIPKPLFIEDPPPEAATIQDILEMKTIW